MKLIALYKTWDGGEWLPTSLASIYDHVDAIVLVHSERSWLGQQGNTARDSAARWADEHDVHDKIHHRSVECDTQEEQYAAGIQYIESAGIAYDAVLAIDCDEIWESQDLARAKEQIAGKPDAAAFRCNMHSYLKTPFYRVDPPYGSPTTFFRDPKLLTQSPRGCRSPAAQLDNVWMHHYTYVRQSRADVQRKLLQSSLADGGEPMVPNWMADVYDKLPDGYHLHAFALWARVWEKIQRVPYSDVPEAVRAGSMMQLFWPDGQLMDGERNELFALARGRRLAVDLGTYRGLSAVILATACERVVTVDLYEDVRQIDTFADTQQPDRYRDLTGHSFEATRILAERFGNLDPVHADVKQLGTSWIGENVDFLFLDADHSREGTMDALEAWWPHLVTGARVVFHDHNELHPGVQAAVAEFQGRYNVRQVQPGEFPGSLVAFDRV